MSSTTPVNLCLSLVRDLNTDGKNLECAICYKRIYTKVFTCSEPCNTAFHPSCIEKMLEQEEKSAYQADIKVQHRCCYCRRDIDMKNYLLEKYSRELLSYQACGYIISEAVKTITKSLGPDSPDLDDESEGDIELILLEKQIFIKKPKKSKKDEYKNQNQRHMKRPALNVKRSMARK